MHGEKSLKFKPKFTLRILKKGVQEFQRKFIFATEDKAANNVCSFEKCTTLTS